MKLSHKRRLCENQVGVFRIVSAASTSAVGPASSENTCLIKVGLPAGFPTLTIDHAISDVGLSVNSLTPSSAHE
jgi:hypothetical protein